MNQVRSIFLALGLCASFHAAVVQAQASVVSLDGRVFPEGTLGQAPAFTLQRETTKTRNTSVLTERFKDLDGNTAALLESTYVSGALQSIAFEQRQTKETASALFKDGRVFFTQSDNGNTKKSDQAVSGKWVALSAVPDEIVGNWDVVTGGKALEFAMPVPIMRDHFGFKVTKERSWSEHGKRLTEFKMQPSSMLIRMMADAFYYIFDDESRTLVEYRGVIIAKALDHGTLKDMKARITYAQASSTSTTGQ